MDAHSWILPFRGNCHSKLSTLHPSFAYSTCCFSILFGSQSNVIGCTFKRQPKMSTFPADSVRGWLCADEVESCVWRPHSLPLPGATASVSSHIPFAPEIKSRNTAGASSGALLIRPIRSTAPLVASPIGKAHRKLFVNSQLHLLAGSARAGEEERCKMSHPMFWMQKKES